tara:strand:- start:2038 stop:3249 length:1212 start_codon:yes stop_codon:yes gene_type:complete
MLDYKETKLVNKVLKSRNLSQFVGKNSKRFYGGKYVRSFEKKLQNFFNVKHAIVVNSWTSGLICCVGALGIKPGDEVIVTPWTMSATVMSILHWNAIPVFVDIERDSFNIDIKKIEKKINQKTKIIIFADIFGNPANYKEIKLLAKKHGLKVIADSAQAPGVKYKGKYCGTITELGGLSFNYHKHIHTGEGGVIFTNNKNLAKKTKMLRNHGENIVSENNKETLSNMIGFNFRMGEIEAAIGIEQLKKLKKILIKKQLLAKQLYTELKKLRGLDLPTIKDFNNHAFYIFPIILDLKKIKSKRSEIVKMIKKSFKLSILIEGYQNIHKLPIFQKKIAYGGEAFPWNLNKKIKYNYRNLKLPVAEELHEKSFIGILMCKYDLNHNHIKKLIKSFQKTWKKIKFSN